VSGFPWPSTTPSPVSQSEAEDGSSPDPFSAGKRVKQRKNGNSETLIELMMRDLEITETEVEQRKKAWETKIEQRQKDWEMLARSEERQQKLVDLMEILVNHIVRE
jgi:hypothetical protein